MWELPTDGASVLEDLQAEGFDTIYLNVSPYIGIYETKDQKQKDKALARYKQRLGKFLRQADALGISVEALTGKANWSNSSHRYLLLEIYHFVQQFNAASSVDFAGIQYDLEPYIQVDYLENREEVLQDYLQTLSDIVNLHQEAAWGSAFRLGLAMPFWWDNTTTNWHGIEGGMGSHAITLLSQTPNSYVVLMSYRGSAAGPDGSTAISEHLLHYANNRFVEVLIGQETKQIEPAKISFFGDSKQSVKRAATELDLAFRDIPAFAGFALHDAQGYLNLRSQ
jgi:hypothetical protein